MILCEIVAHCVGSVAGSASSGFCLEELLETCICWSVLCVLGFTIKVFWHKVVLNVQLWEVALVLKCFFPRLQKMHFIEWVGLLITLCTHNLEVLSSNLSLDTGYFDSFLFCFLHLLQVSVGLIRSQPLPSRSSSTCHLSAILPFDTV